MTSDMEKAQDIDDMSQIHVKYVARLQERALLSKAVTPISNALIAVLDLGVSFAQAIEADRNQQRNPSNQRPGTLTDKKHRKLAHPAPSAAIPIRQLVQESDSDDANEGPDMPPDAEKADGQRAMLPLATTLATVDEAFARLLPFITAGLRSVGRVGAEPMWEQLAERLEMEVEDGARERGG